VGFPRRVNEGLPFCLDFNSPFPGAAWVSSVLVGVTEGIWFAEEVLVIVGVGVLVSVGVGVMVNVAV
jgi:hypothetical protein